MASLGWQDPTWQQLYGDPPEAHEVMAPLQGDPQTSYLDQLQSAAAQGQTLNLSDMPGYRTNLTGS
jgi:hypothetical protein